MKWCADVSQTLDHQWRYICIGQPVFRDALKASISGFENLLAFIERENPQEVLF